MPAEGEGGYRRQSADEALRPQHQGGQCGTASPAADTEQADAHESAPYTSVIGRFRCPKLRKLPSNGPQAAIILVFLAHMHEP